ncbi:GNAT family N-acetyltransferase [Streptomyces sp. NPDC006184]|uniref:GNAT family N-acetyltransferase n=1 Tax=Streptomyces sp. NPDC006184 TaxID=3155455 RepID=UPI0033BC26BA
MLNDVADAVRLQEGPPGVRSILRAIRRLAPASTKDISRAVGLPVPIVAAVGNELRTRGLITHERPSQLTPAGRAVVTELGMDLTLDATCRTCDGRELVIPEVLEEAVARLGAVMGDGPAADMTLDQSKCTPETKVRRVLALLSAGTLPGGSLLLIGDDDLISLAVAVVGDVLGAPLVDQVTVVDISPDILGYIERVSADLGTRVRTVQHDLRNPLPEELHRQFDVAMTDPPYTPEGARLFLSRAVEGLRQGPAHSIFLSFGGKSPDEMLQVQREIMELGLVTNGYIRNFNEYEGSGILGGVGFFQHLLTTSATSPSQEGDYQGPLYTGDKRSRQRMYECVACGEMVRVGAGAKWTSVGVLRAEGCPNCGKGPFRPGPLVPVGADNQAEQPAAPGPGPDGGPRPQGAPEAPERSAAPDQAGATAVPGLAAETAVPDPVEEAAVPDTAGETDPYIPGGRTWQPLTAGERLLLEERAAPYVIRQAAEQDLPAIGAFEVDIARVSFGGDAVDDPLRHRTRLARAMEKSREGMIVAHRPGGPAIGWLWVSVNQNTMTGDRYANFRSLAVAPVERRAEVAELLISSGLEFAVRNGLTEVVGRVHVANVPMRTLYRKFGFTPTSLVMKLRLPAGDDSRPSVRRDPSHAER